MNSMRKALLLLRKLLNRKILTLSDIEFIESNISLITTLFLTEHPNQKRVQNFKEKFQYNFDGQYIDVLLTMYEFPEFNILDYLQLSIDSYNFEISKRKKREEKLMIITRNCIVLNLLVIATEMHFCEKNDDESSTEHIFEDLSFINPLIERFKEEIIRVENSHEIEYDVEVLFFSLLGHKDKALKIKQRHHAYFTKFLIECGLINVFSFEVFITNTVEKSAFCSLNDNEILIFRKILNNAAKRKFYFGFEFLLKNNEFSFILAEGRIWKNLGRKLKNEQVYKLWKIYSENIKDIRETNLRDTIYFEYKYKIDSLTNQAKYFIGGEKNIGNNGQREMLGKIKYKRKKLLMETGLHFVTDLRELLVIFFKNDLKELVLFFLEKFKEKEDLTFRIPLDIFEICLDYDEDISIVLLEYALTQKTAKKAYMHLCLLKNYFRLGRRLLKFKQCKEYLNTPPPKTDSYISWFKKFQIKKKEEIITNINYQSNYYDNDLIKFFKEEDSESDIKSPRNNIIVSNTTRPEKKELFKNPTFAFPKIFKKGFFRNMLLYNKDNIEEEEENINTHTYENKQTNTTNGNSNWNTNSDLLLLNNINDFNNGAVNLINKEKRKLNNVNPNYKKGLNLSMINKPKSTIKSKKFPGMLSYISFRKNKYLSQKEKSTFIENEYYFSKENESSLKCTSDKKFQTINPNESLDVIKLEKILQGKYTINVQLFLIEFLKYGNYVCDILCMLSCIKEKSLLSQHFPRICSYLFVYLVNEEALTKCTEPLLFIGLSAEFIIKISNANKMFLYKAETIVAEIIALGKSIQSSIKNKDMLNYYLMEQTDHKGRSALEIYAENKFTELLMDKSVGSIVEAMRKGSHHNSKFTKYLRMVKILTANVSHEDYHKIVQKKNNSEEGGHYFFEFTEYKNNLSGKYYIDSFLLLATTCYYQYQLYLFSIYLKGSVENVNKVHNFFSNSLLITTVIGSFMNQIFLSVTDRKIKVDIYEFFLTFLLLAAILICYFDLPDEVFPFVRNSEEYKSLIKILVTSVILFICWIKLLFFVMTTYLYGPFIRIMFNIFWDFFTFMLIFICITFLFAQVFTLFFHLSNPHFEYFYLSFVTLFQTAFGIVNFEDFGSLKVFGFTCLIAYTTMSNIILFNLIVGIINNLFNDTKKKSDAERRAMQIIAHTKSKWDDSYGLLILLPAPLNVLSLPFCLLLLSRDNAKTINNYLSHFFYLFLAFIFFAILFIVGIIAYPFAILKSIYHTLYDFFRKKIGFNQSNNRKIIRLIGDILLRPFSLLQYFTIDMFYFWNLVYRNKKVEETEYLENEYVKEYISSLRKVLNDFKFKQQKKIVTLYEMYSKFSLFNQKKNVSIKRYERDIMWRSTRTSTINENRPKSPTGDQGSSIWANFDYNMKSSEEKKELQERMKSGMRDLLDKIVDTEGFILIDRTLTILPYRALYSREFMRYLKFVNVKVFLRGMRKFLFKNNHNNSLYSFKKMRNLIFKLIIKFQILYHYLPNEKIEQIKEIVKSINQNDEFSKDMGSFVRYENEDDKRENDEEGESLLRSLNTLKFNLKATQKFIDNMTFDSFTDSKC